MIRRTADSASVLPTSALKVPSSWGGTVSAEQLLVPISSEPAHATRHAQQSLP